jgi:hypothetical protein
MSGPATEPPQGVELRTWVDAIGELTIPLFAGFSVTAVIVVSDDAASFLLPGEAILALAVASVVLMASVQCLYHARMYLITQAEDSRGGTSSSRGSSDPNGSQAEDSRGGTSSSRGFSDPNGVSWARGARITYHCGIVALLAGLGLTLAPPHSWGLENDLRWFASIIAFVLCAAEAVFTVVRSLQHGP